METDVAKARIIVPAHDLALVLDELHPGWESVTITKDGNSGWRVKVEKVADSPTPKEKDKG